MQWVVNKKANTSTSFLKTDEGVVYVYVHEYVKGEEESMTTIGEGDVIDMFILDPQTGAISEIP